MREGAMMRSTVTIIVMVAMAIMMPWYLQVRFWLYPTIKRMIKTIWMMKLISKINSAEEPNRTINITESIYSLFSVKNYGFLVFQS